MSEQQKQPNTTTLPEFISNDSTPYTGEKDKQSAGNLYRLMLGISSVWLLIVIVYITQFFGWSNLFLMMPDEFGGFLAGITLPLAVIWVVMAYIDRGASFKEEAKLLHTYMNQLVYPEDGAAQTTKAMTDAIRAQVIELQQATKKATEETAKIKSGLNQHVADFAKLVDILEGYSTKTMADLNEGVKIMSQGLDYINEKVNITTNNIESKVSSFSGIADQIQNNMANVSENLAVQIGEMNKRSEELSGLYQNNNQIITLNNEILNNCSSKLSRNFDIINELVAGQCDRMEKVSGNIVERYKMVDGELSERAKKVEGAFNEQSKQILDYLQNMDKTSLIAANKFEEFRDGLNREVDSILTRAKTISDSVELQIKGLTGVSENINDNMNNVEEVIQEKISNLNKTTQSAVETIINNASGLESKISAFHMAQETSSEKTQQLMNALADKSDMANNAFNSIQETIQKLVQELQNNIANAQSATETWIAGLQNAGMLVDKQTGSLIEASDAVNAQSRLCGITLEQQYKQLNQAANKIEETKESLRQQLDDLTRLSNAISDENIETIRNIDTAVQKSQEIHLQTSEIADNFQKQAQSFDLMSAQALARMEDFSAQVNENKNAIEILSQDVAGKAENVASLLAAQVKAVNSATENSDQKHEKLVQLFNSQSAILNNTAENTISYVADVVQALDEKASTINLLFKNQQIEFFDICNKLSENTKTIGNSLKEQVNVLEQSANHVFSRMMLLEEEFGKKAENIATTSSQSVEKITSVNDALAQQNKDVEASINIISKKLKTINDDVRTVLDNFDSSIKNLREETNATSSTITGNCNKIKEANRSLADESKSAALVLEGQIKVLDMNLTKIQSQSETIKDTFIKQKDNISDIVNIIMTQTRMGESSLAQQYKYLTDAADEVAAKMADIENMFKNNTASVVDSSGKLAYEINVLGDRIIKIGEDVDKASKHSIKSIEEVRMSLSNTADDLNETVNNSNAKVNSIVNNYQNYIANFNTVTAEASSGVVEVNNLISSQNDKMIKISEDTKNLVESFNTVLNEASVQLAKRAAGAFDQVKNMSVKLKELSLQLDDATKLTTKHMDTAGEKMRANINEIAANAERISNDIRSSGEVFLKQSDVLLAATGDTLQKVNDAMTALGNTSSDLTVHGKEWLEQSSEFTKMFEKQSQIIEITSAKANEGLRKLEAKYQELQTDTFLSDAAVIFEKMETISIDINRIFNPTTEEEIWKKYYSGDTSAFVRYLNKVMTKNQIAAIRKEFEDNADFRSLVTRYVSDFEMLISKAKGNERAGVLLSVISGSDVGKVYYILAKALDKLN